MLTGCRDRGRAARRRTWRSSSATSCRTIRPRGRSSAESASISAGACTPAAFPSCRIPGACRPSRPASPGKRATTSPSPPGAPVSAFSSSCWDRRRAACPSATPRKCCASDSPRPASRRSRSRAGPRRRLRPSAARATGGAMPPSPSSCLQPPHARKRFRSGGHMAKPAAVIFDAYGTLFDVHSVVAAGRAVTSDPAALSMLLRQKQLEYTWLRTLMGRYEDFWAVTESALHFALRRLDIAASEAEIARLMEAYLSLATFPEVTRVFAALAGTPLGILSNGSPRMLMAAVSSSGLEGKLAHVLSVDAVRAYKPTPAVYELGPRAFRAHAREILFVSSNAWDVAGAKAFGYRTCWCNRAQMPMDNLGAEPDLEVTRLDEIPAKLS